MVDASQLAGGADHCTELIRFNVGEVATVREQVRALSERMSSRRM